MFVWSRVEWMNEYSRKFYRAVWYATWMSTTKRKRGRSVVWSIIIEKGGRSSHDSEIPIHKHSPWFCPSMDHCSRRTRGYYGESLKTFATLAPPITSRIRMYADINELCSVNVQFSYYVLGPDTVYLHRISTLKELNSPRVVNAAPY